MTDTVPKERPILFKGEMVLAIMRGDKTQTRRIMNPQPWIDRKDQRYVWGKRGRDSGPWISWTELPTDQLLKYAEIPFGHPGDRLWVKETFRLAHKTATEPEVIYRASNPEVCGAPWKPSIFMPRSASRETLDITAVKVERLQDISEEDAIAEGVERDSKVTWCEAWKHYAPSTTEQWASTARDSYRTLWESINGKTSWEKNPYVWCIAFKRLTPT